MLHLENSICHTKTGSYILWPWCPCICIKAPAWISSLRQQPSWCDLHYYQIPDCSLGMDGGWDVRSITTCVVLLLLCDSNLWRGQRLTQPCRKVFYKDTMNLLCEIRILLPGFWTLMYCQLGQMMFWQMCLGSAEPRRYRASVLKLKFSSDRDLIYNLRQILRFQS